MRSIRFLQPALLGTAGIALLFIGAPPATLASDASDLSQCQCRRDVIEAMKRAWMQSSNGSTTREAAFRLDREDQPGSYVAVPLGFSNQRMKQRVYVERGRTIAVFHVHPGDSMPDPSAKDREVADALKVYVYTMSIKGLFVYDFRTGETMKLRDRLSWTRPCD